MLQHSLVLFVYSRSMRLDEMMPSLESWLRTALRQTESDRI